MVTMVTVVEIRSFNIDVDLTIFCLVLTVSLHSTLFVQ